VEQGRRTFHAEGPLLWVYQNAGAGSLCGRALRVRSDISGLSIAGGSWIGRGLERADRRNWPGKCSPVGAALHSVLASRSPISSELIHAPSAPHRTAPHRTAPHRTAPHQRGSLP